MTSSILKQDTSSLIISTFFLFICSPLLNVCTLLLFSFFNSIWLCCPFHPSPPSSPFLSYSPCYRLPSEENISTVLSGHLILALYFPTISPLYLAFSVILFSYSNFASLTFSNIFFFELSHPFSVPFLL